MALQYSVFGAIVKKTILCAFARHGVFWLRRVFYFSQEGFAHMPLLKKTTCCEAFTVPFCSPVQRRMFIKRSYNKARPTSPAHGQARQQQAVDSGLIQIFPLS